MQLPKGSGLEVLDRMVRRSIRYYSDLFSTDRFRQSMVSALKNLPTIELPSLANLRRPVDSLVKTLNDAVAQMTSRPAKIDYHNIVSSFLPPGASLIKPQYPENAGDIRLIDLDGDGRSELVTAYTKAEKTTYPGKGERTSSSVSSLISKAGSCLHTRCQTEVPEKYSARDMISWRYSEVPPGPRETRLHCGKSNLPAYMTLN